MTRTSKAARPKPQESLNAPRYSSVAAAKALNKYTSSVVKKAKSMRDGQAAEPVERPVIDRGLLCCTFQSVQ